MKCRTCLTTVLNPNNATYLKKKLNLGKTIEEIILLFIPEMVKSKLVDDYICNNCLKSVQAFETFMKKVITIENYLKTKNPQQEDVKKEHVPVEELTRSAVENSIEDKMQLTKVQNPTTFSNPVRTYPGKIENPMSVDTESVVKSKPRIAVTNIQNLIEETKKSTEECREVINYLNEFLVPLTGTSTIPKIDSGTDVKAVSQNIVNDTVDCLTTNKVQDAVDLTELPVDQPCLDEISNDISSIKELKLSAMSRNISLFHNRVISISQTNEETMEILHQLSITDVEIIGQDTLKNAPTKRILFLGNSFFLCPECKVTYTSYHLLRTHYATAHPKLKGLPAENKSICDVIPYPSAWTRFPQNVCPVCDKRFGSFRVMENHIIQIHEGYYLYSCKECKKQFQKKARYTKHVKIFETYKSCNVRKCNFCQKGVPVSNFKDHIETHRTFKCTKCKKTFLYARTLNKHQEVHQKVTVKKKWTKPHLCVICGKIIIGGSNMTHHMRTHMPGTELLCDKCPKSFKFEVCLRNHMRRVHDDTRQFECPLCKRRAKCRESLKDHIKLKHSDTYTYICYICGSGFMRGDYYKRHLLRHSREAAAGKILFRKNIYMKRNENDPYFTCKYCHREYKTVHRLRIHLLNSHLSKTRYRCRYCDMTFKSAPVRFKHEKRHRDPVAFELTCQICWCRFPDKEKLELHAFKHVGSSRRTCDICGEKFPSKFMLNHHRGIAHFSQEELEQERTVLLEDGLREYRVESQKVQWNS